MRSRLLRISLEHYAIIIPEGFFLKHLLNTPEKEANGLCLKI